MLDKVCLETIVGQDPGLLEPVHSLPDFHQDVIIVDERGEVVLVENVRGNVLNWNMHVFVLCHGSVEVKILNVDGEKARVGSGNDAVEQTFDDGEISGGSGDIAGVVEFVAADSESHAPFLRLVWL